jgi:glycosyltransferase involved in cell wall biosynthesis
LGLSRDLFDCSVVAFDLGPNALVDKLRNAGISVIHIPIGREYVPSAFWRARELSCLIKSRRFDIVQTYHQKSDTLGAMVARVSGTKHIVSSKRDMGRYRRMWHVALNKALRPLFEKVIVVADAVGEMIVSKERVSRSRIVRIYNGVDDVCFSRTTESQRNEERNGLGFDKEDFVVGMVANFRQEKNHDVLFEAASRIIGEIPRLKILTVGGGPLLEKYRKQFANDYIGSRIVFAGPTTDVIRYLRVMDVGCLVPGSNEGFSNAVLEKMSVGLPLIVSDTGGNAEAVIDRDNGLVIGPNDTEALADAIVELHANPVVRARMGVRSRELVEERYTLQEMCRRHEDLYQSLVADEA